jgi:PTH1 family peptidyl-tRNA hydrolase
MLIVGLGNPGEKYEGTRHNVGKIFVQWLATFDNDKDSHFKKDSSGSFYYHKNAGGHVLCYLTNYMNLSGIGVGRAVRMFDVDINKDLYVVHDDLDIMLGSYKLDFAKGPKLHNGLASILTHLHTEEYMRVRIGVDGRDPDRRIAGETYVLQDFTQQENDILKKSVFLDIYKRLFE